MYCPSRRLAIRIVAGAWCLTCFVLVTAYSSVLISFLTAPENYKPMVNSINDLALRPNIHLTLNKGLTPDLVYQVLYTLIIEKILRLILNTLMHREP